MKSVLLVHDSDDESVVSLIPPDRYAEFTGLFEESITRLEALQGFLKTKIENDEGSEGDGDEINLESDDDFGADDSDDESDSEKNEEE
jgi:hypothetical protein